MAGGFSIDPKKISIFEDFLINSFEKTKISASKNQNLYLDSVIAPSALNEIFYNDVNILAPFGSGNTEPRFVIENIKVLSSSIILNKHIKSVLIGKDGTVFKGFAINAKDTELDSFLTNKNKKNFNIAGKMKLNEWKGKKDIEFIIEDIALI